MNRELVEKVANAVLYEGYMLYPYTQSSLKNRERWNFGVLYPPSFDTSEMRTECLAIAGDDCLLDVRLRFLQLRDAVDTGEREIDSAGVSLADCAGEPVYKDFDCEGARKIEGRLEIAAARLEGDLFRISVSARNRTLFDVGANSSREDALPASMLSTHAILSLRGGEFVSLMDPPPEYREAAAGCRNAGAWPVLAGAEGERDAMLSSPIILYDYPEVAPESPGDLFDATEIDEILTLRILTLSEEEKAEIREGGERARHILERSESLPPEQLMKMHGALRGLRRVRNSKPAAVRVSGVDVSPGGRVRLRPRRGGDILDLALSGKLATVEAIEQDFEGNVHLAVVLDDDPGRDLGMMRQPGHRFFFRPEEVEPVR
jgi:hypothetical protein